MDFTNPRAQPACVTAIHFNIEVPFAQIRRNEQALGASTECTELRKFGGALREARGRQPLDVLVTELLPRTDDPQQICGNSTVEKGDRRMKISTVQKYAGSLTTNDGLRTEKANPKCPRSVRRPGEAGLSDYAFLFHDEAEFRRRIAPEHIRFQA